MSSKPCASLGLIISSVNIHLSGLAFWHDECTSLVYGNDWNSFIYLKSALTLIPAFEKQCIVFSFLCSRSARSLMRCGSLHIISSSTKCSLGECNTPSLPKSLGLIGFIDYFLNSANMEDYIFLFVLSWHLFLSLQSFCARRSFPCVHREFLKVLLDVMITDSRDC